MRSPSLKTILLLSTLFATGGGMARAAQPAADKTVASKPQKPLHLATGRNDEAVTIVGHGASRQQQTLTQTQLGLAAAGTNPLRTIGQLPGVSFNSSDPLALDPYSSNVYMRGFSEDQLGFTLDGVPLGAQGYGSSGQGYGNIGGVNIHSAIMPENIARVDVSQGAGAVDVASASNLGGVMQFHSLDPSDRRGGQISQSFGSFASYRTFVRLDSGQLNPSGTKFFVSYGRTTENKWKGSGTLFQQQVNTKLVQPIGQKADVSVFFNWDDEEDPTYADLSKENLQKLGPRVDYYYPDYAAAYRAAQGIYPSGYGQLSDPLDAAYYDGPSKAQNYLGGVKGRVTLARNLEWTTTVYAHAKNFAGYYTSPYYSSPSGAPLAEEEFAAYSRRYGMMSDLTYTIAHHRLNAGVWYENMHAHEPENLYNEPVLGQGRPLDPLGSLGTPFATPWAYVYNNNTFQAHIQDTYHITPNLRINAGFRSLLFTGRSGIAANDPTYSGVSSIPSGGLSANGAFLPQFSVNWQVARHHELFFDFSKNMRTYPQSGFDEGSPWGVTSQSAFSDLQKTLRPEHDFVYEAGYRYTSPIVSAMLTLYRVDFYNRLQSIAVGPLADITSTIANVGSVNMNGVDGSVIIRPIDGLSLSNSVSYNSARYQSNLTSDGITYALRGKQEVNYPEFMYKSSLSYTYRRASARIDAMYMGKRYYSYNNDESVPGYWIANLSATYSVPIHSGIEDITFGFNIYNLTNQSYISITGETGNPLSGDYQTFQIGAPRSYYGNVSVRF